MPASSRLAVWCLALLFSLSLYVKGRAPAEKGEGAAFVRSGTETMTVRFSGDFPRPGVYLLPKGTAALTAINMTLRGSGSALPHGAGTTCELESGDVVTLTRAGRENTVISITKMGVRECMLLRVPLHPDQMGEEDWELLPGIGPALSRRIVAERHRNGAFGSVEGLLRVSGIGHGKLSAIRRYF